MGEALSEGGVFAHDAKARALLEVVRLAFEGDLGFGSELADASCATTAVDSDLRPSTTCPTRHKAKAGKEYAPPAPQQQHQHLQAPHRPASTGSSSRLVPGGPCVWCGVTATPQWRRPRGTNKLLCNACGIYFTRYGRLPEKSHHAYMAAVNADGPAAPLLSAPPSPAVASTPPQDARLDPPEAPDQGAPGGLQAPPPQPHHALQQPLPQQRPSASTSSLAGTSPHKRKHAPQPEAELLLCLEDTSGSACGDDTAASPASAPAPASAARGCLTQQHQSPPLLLPPAHLTQQQQQHALGLALQLRLQQPGAAEPGAMQVAPTASAAAVAVDRPESTLLRVAPLDLGLQHLTHMQQLGLLGPALAGLGVMQMQSLCLQGPTAVAAACNPAAARVLGYAGFAQHAAMSGLAPELLAGRPFSMPVGLLQQSGAAAVAAAAQPAPRSLYARPAKRQERLPAGESDDSNVSTDSHAATHGDAGTWHDEDEGGMIRAANTGGPASRSLTGATASGTSGGAAAAGRPPAGMSCSPPEMPGAHFPLAILARPAAAVPLLPCASPGGGSAGPLLLPPLAPAGGATPGCGAAAPEAPEGDPMELTQPQQQLQTILVPTRRSKGPRSRAASATPSSSAQS